MRPAQEREPFDPGETIWSALRGQEGNERLRLAKRSYMGRTFFDLRLEFKNADGDWIGTRKGVSVRKAEVDALVEALRGAK